MKLVVAVENRAQGDLLPAFDFAGAGISPLAFSPFRLAAAPEIDCRRIATEAHPKAADLELPDFAAIARGLEEGVDACLVFGDGPLARLTATAADLLGISAFSLVTSDDQLRDLGRRDKQPPDLFFLADSRLFPAALKDPRYGSTLLPTGHPGRDLFLQQEDGEASPYADESFGDGAAAGRILAAIDRWRHDALDRAPDLSVIVPAFKEASNLERVCDRLLEALDGAPLTAEILLVDDASPDATYQVARQQMWRSPAIKAFSKPLPRGMGNAIKYGLQQARAPIVAVTMGDGSDEVSKIPEMFAKVRDGGASLAIGSRYRYRRNYQTVPRLYRFWSSCFRLTARILIGIKLSDYTNAFRVYRRDIFKRSGPESGGFEISPETTFKAWFATRRVAEVDVCHLKRASGQSSFSFLRAGPGYLTIVIKAFINRLTGKWFILEW